MLENTNSTTAALAAMAATVTAPTQTATTATATAPYEHDSRRRTILGTRFVCHCDFFVLLSAQTFRKMSVSSDTSRYFTSGDDRNNGKADSGTQERQQHNSGKRTFEEFCT